jgi:hypothetical protein
MRRERRRFIAAKRYTPAEVRARLLATLAEGKPIVIGGAGDGFTAKLEEKGGVDIIGVYNSGRFRHFGAGSLAGLMPMGRNQDMVAEYAPEVCAQVKEVPVVADFCAQDPRTVWSKWFAELAELGGTLLVGGRPRRLDALTRTELRAWLELRRARWPASANPYLLVNQSTAGGLTPVTRGYVQEVFGRLGLTAEQLRIDRLLAEVQASGGDPLTLTRLFGLSDTTAIRYCAELDPDPHPPPAEGTAP